MNAVINYMHTYSFFSTPFFKNVLQLHICIPTTLFPHFAVQKAAFCIRNATNQKCSFHFTLFSFVFYPAGLNTPSHTPVCFDKKDSGFLYKDEKQLKMTTWRNDPLSQSGSSTYCNTLKPYIPRIQLRPKNTDVFLLAYTSGVCESAY